MATTNNTTTYLPVRPFQPHVGPEEAAVEEEVLDSERRFHAFVHLAVAEGQQTLSGHSTNPYTS